MFVEEAIHPCFEQANSTSFVYKVPADFPAFKGHFEGHPLLPGIGQLSFCADGASRLLHKPVEIRAVKRAKFVGPVLPNTHLEITFTARADGWYLVELTNPERGQKISQFILQFVERK